MDEETLASNGEAAPPPELTPDAKARADALEAGLAKNPLARALYLQLAQLYQDAGRKDLAIQVLERCLQVDPKNATVRNRIHVLSGAASPLLALRKVQAEAGVEDIAPPPMAPEEAQAETARVGRIALGALAAGGLVLLLVAVKVLLFPSTRLLVAAEQDPSRPVFSPKGNRIAFTSLRRNGSKLCIYDLAKGTVKELVDMGDYGWGSGSVAWSSDGTRIAYVAFVTGMHGGADDEELDEESWSSGGEEWGDAVFVVDVESGSSRRVAMGMDPSWAPDSVTLAFLRRKPWNARDTSDDGDGTEVCTVNTITGAVTKLTSLSGRNPRFSPAGDKVVFESSDGLGWDDDTGPSDDPEKEGLTALAEGALAGGAKNLGEARKGVGNEAASMVHGKGKGVSLAYLARPTNLYAVSAIGGDAVALTDDRRSTTPLFTRDGSRIVFTHFAPGSSDKAEIWTMSSGGGDAKPFLNGAVEIWDPDGITITPDGKKAVFTAAVEGANQAVSMAMTGKFPADLHVAREGSKDARRLANKHSFKQSFCLSPDGTRVVYEVRNMETGAAELWMMKL